MRRNPGHTADLVKALQIARKAPRCSTGSSRASDPRRGSAGRNRAGLFLQLHREQTIIIIPDRLIALTCPLLDLSNVEDCDVASTVFNEARRLERASYQRNAGAANAKHLR